MIVLTILAVGEIFLPIIFPSPPVDGLFDKGQGTALLLVGATIIFAVVFEGWNKGRLVFWAGFAIAFFGFLGTSYILVRENACATDPLRNRRVLISIYRIVCCVLRADCF